mmetsp:Transcript_9830/g.24888  ORF Transcript_9830/g.24888 Transcript_9830/m.24888 type:complete len:318 (+) Transcript_9830:644-1597(+)
MGATTSKKTASQTHADAYAARLESKGGIGIGEVGRGTAFSVFVASSSSCFGFFLLLPPLLSLPSLFFSFSCRYFMYGKCCSFHSRLFLNLYHLCESCTAYLDARSCSAGATWNRSRPTKSSSTPWWNHRPASTMESTGASSPLFGCSSAVSTGIPNPVNSRNQLNAPMVPPKTSCAMNDAVTPVTHMMTRLSGRNGVALYCDMRSSPRATRRLPRTRFAISCPTFVIPHPRKMYVAVLMVESTSCDDPLRTRRTMSRNQGNPSPDEDRDEDDCAIFFSCSPGNSKGFPKEEEEDERVDEEPPPPNQPPLVTDLSQKQ